MQSHEGEIELQHRLQIVFACGREVPYSEAWQYRGARNRKPCPRCGASGQQEISWNEVEGRYLERQRQEMAQEGPAAGRRRYHRVERNAGQNAPRIWESSDGRWRVAQIAGAGKAGPGARAVWEVRSSEDAEWRVAGPRHNSKRACVEWIEAHAEKKGTTAVP